MFGGLNKYHYVCGMKSTKKEIIEKSIEMYNKYNRLLWYVRVKPERLNIPTIRETMEQIQRDYPNEIEQLHGDDSNWVHGFNSGCNAAFAYILSMAEFGIEQADEDFPELDT